MPKPSKKLLKQIMLFNLGGAAFFVIGYGVFALLYGVLHWHWLIAKGIGDSLGWAVNYIIQRYGAFKEQVEVDPNYNGERHILTKYTAFSVMNIGIDYAIVGGLKFIGVSPFIGMFIASGFFTIWKWLWYKLFVFKVNAK